MGIAASELLAGLVPGVPSLVVAVGSLVIALQPPGAKDAVATLFGTNDKTALTVAVVVVALLVAAAAGSWAAAASAWQRSSWWPLGSSPSWPPPCSRSIHRAWPR